jgi:hypothetical protein
VKIKSVFFTLLPLAALPWVHASPIDITTSGGLTPKHDLGHFDDHAVDNWLTSDISHYNSLHGTGFCGTDNFTSGTSLEQGNGADSITLDVTGCDYIFLDWGGPHGDQAQAYYVGDCSGTYTFGDSGLSGHPDGGGLSFYCCYKQNSVPDGGSTGLMLGAALAGLGVLMMIRRFKS